ncbi:hypothetical protein [Halomonas dongshanensis]|uniref:Uncharacterized protein n=1 Tax=Halomonas dongshanensis TaxID=2890835 RepID=A0ABT2EFQ6_9GAMM|nr:hypothetical protein [Halomonas dongshanensis]
MAVYGEIRARELDRWLNALINAAFDRRCPLASVHGGTARARTARQDLLHLAQGYRSNRVTSDATAAALGRWCRVYLSEAEWYVLTSPKPTAPPTAAHDDTDADALTWLRQHRVG